MFISESHRRHRDDWARDAQNASRDAVHESWFRTDTADYWRHRRMYEPAEAFLNKRDARWLTVGDGRYGLDSIRLRGMGFTSVLPSDIGGALLEEARKRGLIEDFALENAEALSFADASFDFVFCKESFHHFPRPMIALYEMLRVARTAVIVVEPRDFVIDHGPTRAVGPSGILRGMLTWWRDRRGKPHPRLKNRRDLYVIGDSASYEDVGNYQYSISSRELEKVCLGLDLPALALKGLNDSYIPGGEMADASDDSTVFSRMKSDIATADARTAGGRSTTSLLMAVLFKKSPDQHARQFFEDREWLYRDLPRNPHLQGSPGPKI